MGDPRTNDTEDRAKLELVSGDSEGSQQKSFFEELRYRKVYQTSAIYVAAAWALIQFADIVVPRLGLPEWFVNATIWALMAGFPIVLILSWVFEIKSHGWPAMPRAISRALSSVRYVVLWTVSCLVIVAVVTFVFGVTPRQTFALAPQDSVVIGTFQNHTNNESLDNSLGLALRVGLQQSRHTFIVSRLQVRDALAQMVIDPDSEVDRAIGVQVAQRLGAKALILGSVGRVGTTYKLAVEVINAVDGRTVLLESVTANHINEILTSLDGLTRQLRAQLGESVDAISNSTLQLERVTTTNFDALKAYSLGMHAASAGDIQDAVSLFERAINLDPEFSMAHAKLAALYAAAIGDAEKAAVHRKLALQYGERLTERERLYVEASQTVSGSPAEMIRAWRLMRNLYPEEAVGHHNLATVYWRYENNFVEAAESYEAAVSIDNPWQNISRHYLGYAQLGLGQAEQALQSFQASLQNGLFPIDAGLADAYVVLGRHDLAEEFLDRVRQDSGQQLQFEVLMKSADILIDSGQLREAAQYLTDAANVAREFGQASAEHRAIAAKIAIMEQQSDKKAFFSALNAQVELKLPLVAADEPEVGFPVIDHLLFLGKIAARNGDTDLAERIMSEAGPLSQDSGFYFRDAFRQILASEIALARGEAGAAVQLLLEVEKDQPLFQARESLARAYSRAGDISSAVAAYEWLKQNRGLPFAEVMADFYGKEFSILNWATAHYHLGQLHEQSGDESAAIESYKDFLDLWRFGDDGLALRKDAEQRLAVLEARS